MVRVINYKGKKTILNTGEDYLEKRDLFSFRYTNIYGKRVGFTCKTLEGLRERKEEVKYDMQKNSETLETDITVLEMCNRYHSYRKDLEEVKLNTLIADENSINVIRKSPFINKKVKALKCSRVEKWFKDEIKAERYSANTMKGVKGFLYGAFKHLQRDGYFASTFNPFDFNIKVEKKEVYLTIEQQNGFLEFVKNHRIYGKYYDYMVVLLETGLRISEFCALTKEDISFDNMKINVDKQMHLSDEKKDNYYPVSYTKTSAGKRVIEMSINAKKSLQRIIKANSRIKTIKILKGYSGFIIISRTGMPRHKTAIEKIIRDARNEYKEEVSTFPEITPHSLRHTYATNRISEGMSPVVLQSLMGHADFMTTMNIYVHFRYGENDVIDKKIRCKEILDEYSS